jgi:hypothetical protein
MERFAQRGRIWRHRSAAFRESILHPKSTPPHWLAQRGASKRSISRARHTSMIVTILVSTRSKSVGFSGPGVQVNIKREATSDCDNVSTYIAALLVSLGSHREAHTHAHNDGSGLAGTCDTMKSTESEMAASRSPCGNCWRMYFCKRNDGIYGNLQALASIRHVRQCERASERHIHGDTRRGIGKMLSIAEGVVQNQRTNTTWSELQVQLCQVATQIASQQVNLQHPCMCE